MEVQWIQRKNGQSETKNGETHRLNLKVTVQILADTKSRDLSKYGKGIWHVGPALIKELGITKQECYFDSPQKAGSSVKMDFVGDLLPDFRTYTEKKEN